MGDNAVLENKTDSSPAPGVVREVGIGTVSDLQPAETETIPQIDDELKGMGIKGVKDSPDLDQVHKELGVTHSGAAVPIKVSFSEDVVVPTSSTKLNSYDSEAWLEKLSKKALNWEKHGVK